MSFSILGFGVTVWFAASVMQVPYQDLLAFAARMVTVLGIGFLITVGLAVLLAYKKENCDEDIDEPRH